MKQPRAIKLFVFALFTLVLPLPPRASAQDRPLPEARHDVEPGRYRDHVCYLADDALEGRLPGMPGGIAATEYIAEQFKAIGLKPGGTDGAYFQPFTIERIKRRHDELASVRINGENRPWKIGTDWIPMPFSKPAAFAGPLAFAGYGISAAKFEYDDYADFDVKGKILIVIRYEPKAPDPQSEFGGETPSRHALFSKKAALAAEHGARGLLIVNQADREGEMDQLYPWYDWDAHQTYALPIVHVRRALADELLEHGKLPKLAQLQEQLDRERRSLSADLQDISIEIETGLRFVEGRNVLGILPGNGDTGETIVVGAHHDHVGNIPDDDGPPNVPVIHNGADDNASGTAGVLELARVLAADGPYRRNILFMTFDAEELGLLGSNHFVEYPTVPLESIRAMINLDMIGRLSQNHFTIFGAGSAREFRELLDDSAQQLELTFHAPRANTDWFGGSDHYSFYAKNIPVLFLFTNIHKQYHRPEDDCELVDVDGACRVLRLIRPVIAELANLPEGPDFIPADQEAAPPDEQEVAKAPEAPKARGGQRRGGEGLRVSLRLIPDHAYTKNDGVRILSVLDNGPAEQAGLQDGDIVVKIGEDRITDIYSYMETLKQYEPNQKITVVVRRGDQETAVEVTLGEARRRYAKPRDKD